MKNSCLYECTVMHDRIVPKKNRFRYKTFMFSLDLDELDELASNNMFVSRNRFNLFNFRDRDHLHVDEHLPVKEQIEKYLVYNGIEAKTIGRIQLVTNLCTLGYQFNPVSFYFCFDRNEHPLCAVVEVCNTFGELKPYFIDGASFRGSQFRKGVKKNFYVSPFIDLDAEFHFDLRIPAESIIIHINDRKNGQTFFHSSLTGSRKALTSASALYSALRFPLITLQVITVIHWQALKLLLKGIPWHRKTANISLQRGVLRPHKSITQ